MKEDHHITLLSAGDERDEDLEDGRKTKYSYKEDYKINEIHL